MPKTALLLDSTLQDHRTAIGHPECPERLTVIREALESLATDSRIVPVSPKSATPAEVALCHDPGYVEWVLDAIRNGETELAYGDVSVCAQSGEIALRAVGGVLHAVDMVFADKAKNAFCAVRPPGHHARPAAAMGFCLFNNVSIAARYAQKHHGAERIAIVDWDVHHGNGTQEIFYSDNSVLFFSTHQWPWYPGTGHFSEIGDGPGKGFTINHPFPAGAGRHEILGAFRKSFLPALKNFRPDLILISAGFDSRLGDPLGSFRLTDEDFAEMTHLLLDAAATYCNDRVVSVLEGGYNLKGLAAAVATHLRQLIE